MAQAQLANPYRSEAEALGKRASAFRPNLTLVPKPVPGELTCLDCFAGAGGFSTALLRVARLFGFKVHHTLLNHWSVALDNARENLGDVRVINGGIQDVDPREAVPGGYVDIMLASPECIFFSAARGARPINDQRRSTAAEILRFLEELYVETLVLENVSELESWGPLDEETQRPIVERKGEYFKAFLRAIKRLGYQVSFQHIVAADHGDPTTRKRLFLVAQKSRRASFPTQSHSKNAKVPGTLPWVPARAIIDFDVKGLSIFGRPIPHVTKTLRRIGIGFDDQTAKSPLASAYVEAVSRFQAATAEYYNQIDALPSKKKLGRELTKDEKTLVKAVKQTAQRQHRLLVEEIFRTPVAEFTWEDLLLHESVQPTIQDDKRLTLGTLNAVAPVVTKLYGTGTVSDVNAPLDTVTAGGINFGVANPVPDTFLVTVNHGDTNEENGRHTSLDAPLNTVTTKGSHGVVEPFCLRANASDTSAWDDAITRVDAPLRTVTTKNNLSLVLPDATILPQHTYNRDTTSTPDVPLPTITTISRHGLAQPTVDVPGSTPDAFICSRNSQKANTNNRTHALDEPVLTATASGAGYLVDPTIEAIPGAADAFICSRNTQQAEHINRAHGLDEPMLTATTSGAGYLVDPTIAAVPGAPDAFVASYYGTVRDRERRPRSIDAPLATQTTENRFGLIDPIVVNLKGQSTATSVDDPLPTQTAHAAHFYIAEGTLEATAGLSPVLVSQHYGFDNANPSLEAPMVTTSTRGAGYIAQPHIASVDAVIIPQQRGAGVDADSIERPLRALTTKNGTGVAVPMPEGFVTPNFGERDTQKPRTHSLEDPVPTATSHGAGMLVQPDVSKVEPGKPYVIVSGNVLQLDVLYRMLTPDELSKAMSFTSGADVYRFKNSASTSQRVKMIGNAVAVRTAMAIIGEALAYRFLAGEVPVPELVAA
jgi:DNA (cytosine-5)-methyltransferase 1